MRGRGLLALFKGHTQPDEGEDEALLLTERAPETEPSPLKEDWWYSLEIRMAMDAPMKSTLRPEWENDVDPWPDDESAIC